MKSVTTTTALMLLLATNAMSQTRAFGGATAAKVCFQGSPTRADPRHFYYAIVADDVTGTMLYRYDAAVAPLAFVDQNWFAVLHPPADGVDGPWGEGLTYASTMQTRFVWPYNATTTNAAWITNSSGDFWIFETAAPTPQTVAFRTSHCQAVDGIPLPPPPVSPSRCRSLGGPSVTCGAEESCCGGGSTIAPVCVSPGKSDKCCLWYKSAAKCNATQTCCGELGPGASSRSFCCDEGSTCCTAYSAVSAGTASCCPAGSTCCRGATRGLCCGPDEECAPTADTCRKITTRRVCLSQANSTDYYYDITTDRNQTVLLRYNTAKNPPVLIDRNTYAALHGPTKQTDMWGEGVAFASTMQTRFAWVYKEPTVEAYWDHDVPTGADTWRFKLALGRGQTKAKVVTFQSTQCLNTTNATTRAILYTLCMEISDSTKRIKYAISVDTDSTALYRYDFSSFPPKLMDGNQYAALLRPRQTGVMWGDGVAFATTMQTRHVWMYDEPTTAAFWERDFRTAEDTWRFEATSNTTANGGGRTVTYRLRSRECSPSTD